MTDKKKTKELTDADLDNVLGGVGLLLPAVQQVREGRAATKTSKEFLSSGHTGRVKSVKGVVATGGGSGI